MLADDFFPRLLGHAQSKFGEDMRGSEAKAAAFVERRVFEHELLIAATLAEREALEHKQLIAKSLRAPAPLSQSESQKLTGARRQGPLEKFLIAELDTLLESSSHGNIGTSQRHATVSAQPLSRNNSTPAILVHHPNGESARRRVGRAAVQLPQVARNPRRETPATGLGRNDIASDAMHRSVHANCGVGMGQSELTVAYGACGALPARSHRFLRPSSSQPALRHLEFSSSRHSSSVPFSLLGDVADCFALQPLGKAPLTRPACSRAMPASTISDSCIASLPAGPRPPRLLHMLRVEALASKLAEGQLLSKDDLRILRNEAAKDEAWSDDKPSRSIPAAAAAPPPLVSLR